MMDKWRISTSCERCQQHLPVTIAKMEGAARNEGARKHGWTVAIEGLRVSFCCPSCVAEATDDA